LGFRFEVLGLGLRVELFLLAVVRDSPEVGSLFLHTHTNIHTHTHTHTHTPSKASDGL
jgi:hypothetical protein